METVAPAPPVPEVNPGQTDLTTEAGWPPEPVPENSLPEGHKIDLAGETVPMSDAEKATQASRDEWSATHKGAPVYYREQFDFDADGNKVVTQEATIKPEDVADIELFAQQNNLDRLSGQREKTGSSWGELEKVYKDKEDELTKRAIELGIIDESTPLDSPQYLEYKNDFIGPEAAKAREEALQKKLDEAFPLPQMPAEADRKDRKAYKADLQEAAANREALSLILSGRDPAVIDNLKNKWAAYDEIVKTREMDELHSQALADDKSIKSKDRLETAQATAETLNEKYSGALSEVAKLPLYRDMGANLANGLVDNEARKQVIEILKAHQDRLGQIKNDIEREMVIRKATNDLRWKLGERLGGMGIEQPLIEKTTGQAAQALELLVRQIKPGDNVVVDLETYMNNRRSEQLWSARRNRAGRYLGALAFLRPRSGGETAPLTSELDVSIGEIRQALGMAIDPTGARHVDGAAYLANPDAPSKYRERVMAQVDLFRQYSRHEGNLMKAAMLLWGVGVRPAGQSGGEAMAKAWEKLSDKEKLKRRKAQLFGLYGTSKGLAGRVRRRRQPADATAPVEGA